MASGSSYAPLVESEAAIDDAYDALEAAEAALDALSSVLLQAEAKSEPEQAMATLKAAGEAAESARRLCRELELESSAVGADEVELHERQAVCARRLQQLLKTLDFVRGTRQREVLLASAKSSSSLAAGHSSGNSGIDAEKLSPSDLIALSAQVQDESQASVGRMLRMVESSKQVGSSTLVDLEQQKGKLERLLATTAAQEAQFAMAEAEIREFAQESFGDYITQVLVVLICMGLAFIASWHISESGSEPSLRGPHSRNGGWATTVYSALDLRPE